MALQLCHTVFERLEIFFEVLDDLAHTRHVLGHLFKIGLFSEVVQLGVKFFDVLLEARSIELSQFLLDLLEPRVNGVEA